MSFLSPNKNNKEVVKTVNIWSFKRINLLISFVKLAYLSSILLSTSRNVIYLENLINFTPFISVSPLFCCLNLHTTFCSQSNLCVCISQSVLYFLVISYPILIHNFLTRLSELHFLYNIAWRIAYWIIISS